MDLDLTDKRVVVTGASRGIGLACAETFLQEGAAVTLVSRRSSMLAEQASRLAARYPESVASLGADLSTAAGVEMLAPVLGEADIVVNNAGAIPGGTLESVDDASWRRAWDLKLFGYLEVCRRCLPAMRRRGSGVVVNIIGQVGSAPRYDYLSGSMANAALMSFTRAAGGVAARAGVRIVGINPGPTQTERLVTVTRARARERFGDEERWPEALAHLPFGRAALPEEIANLAVFVASPRASYLSGVVIDADGGAMYTDG